MAKSFLQLSTTGFFKKLVKPKNNIRFSIYLENMVLLTIT